MMPLPAYVALAVAAVSPGGCRDRLKEPFASSSIWNTAIGSGALMVPAGIYPAPAHIDEGCAAGKGDPSKRTGCPGWQPHWSIDDCYSHGCCYDPHPSPDPAHYPWCYANSTMGGGPERFRTDVDFFVATAATDPVTDFVNQGWWGNDPECGYNHCCKRNRSKTVGTMRFPYNWTVNQTSNNAAAILLPDHETLVQVQPLVRCTPGSPLFAIANFLKNRTYFNGSQWVPQPQPANISILGNGTWGAHGGSLLSSIGGTIRLGELLPGAPPIGHALKLMLYAAQYYYPGDRAVGCYRWPALRCDGSWNASRDPGNKNYYNGTDPRLKPGALLAVPGAERAALLGNGTVTTPVGVKLLEALTDYGGYLDDNTASNSGAFNIEGGVAEEVAAAYAGLNLRDVRPGTALYNELVAIYRTLHIVDNNAPSAVGGGGTPRRPTKPPICDV